MIQHVMQVNLKAAAEGRHEDKVVLCIWGPAGISKTANVKQLEKVGVNLNGEKVYPKVTHIALAQLEESGDLVGLPVTTIDPRTGTPVTTWAMPEWWPSDEDTKDETGKVGARPVVLLFDDFNRADPRILKAIMQILQDYKSNIHKLPENCHIMLTGNPPSDEDGTEYMVNEIDKAILTRMVHISMKFDKTDWAVWAESADVEKSVINYVLAYPEMVDGTRGIRTNPRSIVQLSNLIRGLDLKGMTSKDDPRAQLVDSIINSCVDTEVATGFMKFVIGDMQKLVDPEEILNNWPAAEKKLEQLKKRKKTEDGEETTKVREDLIGIIMERMYTYLMRDDLKLGEKQFEGFRQFCKRTDLIPKDLTYMTLRRLRRDGNEQQQKLFVSLIQHGGAEYAELITQIL
jgi:hypothetical protein